MASIESGVDNSNGDEIEDQISAEESSDEEDKVDMNEWKLVEEDFVSLDLIGLITKDTLQNCDKSKLKLIGINDEHPVLQIGKFWFVGDREEVPGTNVLFQIDDDADQSSSEEESFPNAPTKENNCNTKLSFKCTTRKKLLMHQAFLQNKDKVVGPDT